MNLKINQAVIFCGGFGTRIKKYTHGTPKPLFKINNKSFLKYLIENITRFGLNEIFLLCHFKTKIFRKEFKNYKYRNCKIHIIHEKEPLGSGGSLKNIKRKLKKYFYIFNGDTFFDFDYLDLKENLNNKNIVTLATVINPNVKHGNLLVKKNKVIGFGIYKNKNINTGVGIVNKKIFKYLDDLNNNFISLEKELYPILCTRNEIGSKKYNLRNYNFIDIGTPKDFKKIKKFLKKVLLKPAVILDRDGIVNIDKGYTYKIKGFKWRKNIIRLIKKLNRKNYYVFIATNQSGIGRGYYKETDVKNLHKWMNHYLNNKCAHIDEFFYAPYYENSKFKKYRNNRNLRKPNIGMYKKIISKWYIDKKKSFVIGDTESDIKFAKNAGLNGILIKPKDDVYKVSLKKLKTV